MIDEQSTSICEKFSSFDKQYLDLDEKLKNYHNLLDSMERGELTPELLEECPELLSLHVEVEKLAYRAGIIKQSIEEQKMMNKTKRPSVLQTKPEIIDKKIYKKKKEDTEKIDEKKDVGQNKQKEISRKELSGDGCSKQAEKFKYVEIIDYGDSMLCFLNDLFSRAVKAAFSHLDDTPLVISEVSIAKFGDYQFNSSMLIAQKLGKLGQKITPRDVAKLILDNFEKTERIEKVEVAGAGYINVFLNRAFISHRIFSIATEGVMLPKIARRRVVVDFSSPNIAKQMHVGHLRSTIIGESICRLFEYLGFDVLRINHIGDWGTQFGMLIANLQDRFPNFVSESPSIGDLQAFYKESKKRFDEDSNFKARAYECVVKLQSADPSFLKAWNQICDVSRKDFSSIYDRLDVKITERGESFYRDKMPAIVKELDERGFLKLDEGRKLIFPTGCDIPLTVVKSDGGYTYDTSDLAALEYRLKNDKADWVIYVVDSGQSLHLQTVYAAARDLGWYNVNEKRVEHVAFGLVLGEDKKKFKTRSGETIRLVDLLDEGVKRAAAKLQEKGREKVMSENELNSARDAVAYGCIKYADLSQTRTQDYVFSFNKMLDDKGNTAVYLLYAYARIRSIRRNVGISEDDLLTYLRSLPDGVLPLEHEAELKLAKAILKFSDCLLTVLDSLMLHQVCDYVYSLSTTFHDFYNTCYVLHKDREGNSTLFYHRLVLCEVTADIMAKCFNILGLRTVEKM